MAKLSELFAALFTDDFWDAKSRASSPAWALAALWLYVFAGMLHGWVWLLDSASLALHEAGHPLCSFISLRLTVYGGTLFQLIFPAVFAASFARRGQFAGFVFCCCWLGASLRNVGAYCADARAMALPLIGGADPEQWHDWREILSRWGALPMDHLFGGVFQLAGYALMGLALCLIAWHWKRPAKDEDSLRF